MQRMILTLTMIFLGGYWTGALAQPLQDFPAETAKSDEQGRRADGGPRLPWVMVMTH